jgi:ribose transport system substrate-binding protein
VKKLNILVSLITKDNDYQVEQANAARATAQRLGVTVEVIFADNDAIIQSQQLLKVIQSPAESHPDAIVLEPVGGTGLPHVARAAVAAGMGWVVLNRETDYVTDLRQKARSPVFGVSSDHVEIGRIQGQHVTTLSSKESTILYIQGPSTSSVVKQRTIGLHETKPSGTNVILLRGQWTEDSAYRAVCSWMLLSTSQKVPIEMVVAQNDDMAMGARKAFQEHADEAVRDKWLSLPFVGCDGLPNTGQEYVRRGQLAATVVLPAITTLALETLVHAIPMGTQPPELALAIPISFPSIEDLVARRQRTTKKSPIS